MNNQFKELEDTISFYSQEIRVMAAEIKRLYQELELERSKTESLLYIMAGNDRIDEKDIYIITLQMKVNRAISMLEYSADPMEVLDMLKEKVDFSDTDLNL